MSMTAAFNMLIMMHSRPMIISRRGTATTGTVRVAPSNYFRHLEVAGAVTEEGREFVVSKSALDLISYPRPKKGDSLVDPDMGTMIITEAREMFSIGAEIVGYRLRVG